MLVLMKKIARNTKKLLRHWRLMTGVVIGFGLVFTAGYWSANTMHNRHTTNLQTHYNLLSKRALSDNPSDARLDFQTLQQSYQDYISQNGLDGKVSLYFEYLPTGSSIGIGEDKQLVGASLLKVPLSIAFYKQVERGKIDPNTTVSLKKEWLSDTYGTLYKKGVGYQLTYQQALQYMLRDSDNTAALTIYNAVAKAEGTDKLDLLGFVDAHYSQTKQQNVLIGPQAYTSVLKCLYYACYVNRDHSQAILSQLTHSENNDRLAAFTPNSLVIAHKIGTFGNENQSDCGIFYVAKRNYALCVMVQESDPQASRVIGDISLMTYEYIAPDDSTVGNRE